MGLMSTLNNAVTGLRINQDSLTVVSRNVANSGTPGYHRQSLNVVDYADQSSTYARTVGVNRAFNKSLQTYYTRQVSDAAMSSVEANYLDRLQTYLGKPGDAGALDNVFQDLQNALSSLATSPDDYTVRAQVVAHAQTMAETLNRLSSDIQTMRQETEGQIAADVHALNGMLTSLQEVNLRLLDLGTEDGARANLLDQRDRLVSQIAEKIDLQADYRPDGTVALMTRSGVGLLDGRASTFKFESAGNLAATSQFNYDPDITKVGKLMLTTPSGLTLDLVQQGVIQGGELGGLLTLRDRTLVEAQSQLDEIAASLAQAFGTVQTSGQAVTAGAAEGFELDIGDIAPGQDMLINYVENGVSRQVRVVNTTQDLDYKDASGVRVIGVDMSAGATSMATRLDSLLPGLDFANPSGTMLRVLDDGATGNIDIGSVVGRTSSTAAQGAGLALNLFVDSGNSGFTNNLDTDPPQKLGFAARISVNTAVIADNRVLVQHEVGGSLGDSSRPDYLVNQLKNMKFVSGGDPKANPNVFQLNGNASEIVSQVMGYQGSSIASALSRSDGRQLTLDTVVQQMDTEYGVNIDEEMARLIELQNAYAANARVVSIVQELLAELFRI
ncbi:flagellar hook-associated protein FlgK [Devosia nitrariae]|uniref:Flagellar hook-associated protein 1 n=1 Tax=Devosia nitrariae TaxID=2071872 RepID=A0ABQ5WBZ6_9HYPH|nr:flagellar hook-associated protein FlgK [Devosia nitrariae]GLQ57311.1 flagellar hook-associated protein FlgK [Devosia nitrariae]